MDFRFWKFLLTQRSSTYCATRQSIIIHFFRYVEKKLELLLTTKPSSNFALYLFFFLTQRFLVAFRRNAKVRTTVPTEFFFYSFAPVYFDSRSSTQGLLNSLSAHEANGVGNGGWGRRTLHRCCAEHNKIGSMARKPNDNVFRGDDPRCEELRSGVAGTSETGYPLFSGRKIMFEKNSNNNNK